MRTLTKGTDLNHFFESVANGSERLLVLDYDGTLAPFRIERGEAFPYSGIAPLVRSIMESPRSRVVVVSGRAVGDLKALLGFEPVPELYGSHGWEHMNADGRSISLPLGREAQRGLGEALSFLEEEGLSSYAEIKHGSIAFHWRGRSGNEIDSLRNRLQMGWGKIAERYGLGIISFDGGLELRTPGNDKGTALRNILDQEPSEGVAAYLGDDITDEDAFVELEGRGLRVLVNNRLRPTSADIWIRPPDELILFLRRWSDACRK